MGIYLVSVDAGEWFGDDAEEGGKGAVAAGLDAELRRRGLPPYEPAPGRGAASWFEEKLSPSMTGFAEVCRAHLTPQEQRVLGDWSVLVPVSLEGARSGPCVGTGAMVSTIRPSAAEAGERLSPGSCCRAVMLRAPSTRSVVPSVVTVVVPAVPVAVPMATPSA